MVHANSRRRHRPFVKVNVGALPDTLIEAELFGAEAGAYTGAQRRRVRALRGRRRRHLLLDEIANLSPAGQAKLLRVLQSGEFERLGSSADARADVRVIAATNADLRAAVAARAVPRGPVLPPQRHRAAGAAARRTAATTSSPLAEHFLAARPAGEPSRRFAAAASTALLRHDWPGNVRELRNRVQRALILAEGPEHRRRRPRSGDRARRSGPSAARRREADERRRIEDALRARSGVIAQAAAVSG